jgi:hypothetical protein
VRRDARPRAVGPAGRFRPRAAVALVRATGVVKNLSDSQVPRETNRSTAGPVRARARASNYLTRSGSARSAAELWMGLDSGDEEEVLEPEEA